MLHRLRMTWPEKVEGKARMVTKWHKRSELLLTPSKMVMMVLRSDACTHQPAKLLVMLGRIGKILVLIYFTHLRQITDPCLGLDEQWEISVGVVFPSIFNHREIWHASIKLSSSITIWPCRGSHESGWFLGTNSFDDCKHPTLLVYSEDAQILSMQIC